jgi:hypothetical protein
LQRNTEKNHWHKYQVQLIRIRSGSLRSREGNPQSIFGYIIKIDPKCEHGVPMQLHRWTGRGSIDPEPGQDSLHSDRGDRDEAAHTVLKGALHSSAQHCLAPPKISLSPVFAWTAKIERTKTREFPYIRRPGDLDPIHKLRKHFTEQIWLGGREQARIANCGATIAYTDMVCAFAIELVHLQPRAGIGQSPLQAFNENRIPVRENLIQVNYV